MPQVQTPILKQLTLFTPEGNAVPSHEAEPTNPVVIPMPVRSKKTVQTIKKKDSNDILNKLTAEAEFKVLDNEIREQIEKNNFYSLLKLMNIKGFNFDRARQRYINKAWVNTYFVCYTETDCYQYVMHDQAPSDNERDNYIIIDTENKTSGNGEKFFTLNIAYTSKNSAETIMTPVKVVAVYNYANQEDTSRVTVMSMKAGKPFIPTKIMNNVIFVQTDGELCQILQEKKPWIVKWLTENQRYDYKRYLAAPWLETLDKAGYRNIAGRFLNREKIYEQNELENMNKLCISGSKPKDIFKCSKSVFNVLKEEKNLYIWDTMRKLEKKGAVTGDAVLLVYEMGLQPKELDLMNYILGVTHAGQHVFTLTSLTNYINRLDMYEAINHREALEILNDYLHMCNQLEMPPRIDGDSLKREHDIAARLCREQRNKIMEKKMKELAEREKKEIEEGNKKLSKAAYNELLFFIRPITDYNDLLDEAIQQDNCVASYASRIVEGKSRIFTMRETSHPEKSLVTIELSPDCKTIRQKFLAHNQPIRNKAMNDFIDRWHKQLNA